MTHIHIIIIMNTSTKNSHSHEEQDLFSCRATWVSSSSTLILGGRRAASRRPALKIHEEELEDSQEHNIDLLYVPIGVRLTTEVRRSRERVTPGVTLAAALRYTRYIRSVQHPASILMDQSRPSYRALSLCFCLEAFRGQPLVACGVP